MPHLAPKLLYTDDALIVADKPAGLRSVPAGGEDRQDCLARRVQAEYPDALIVHRLDAATSGLVLLARGVEMLRRMSLAFEQRVIGKRYMALVHGHVAQDEGEIALPLAADPDDRPRQIVDAVHGRPALTRYRVVERLGEGEAAVTRLELKPLTGRSHQLRVHLLSIGHPIVGDPLYAPPESAAAHPRMYLHAAGIAFIHPERRVPMRFDSPAPF
ncbi:RluA family pseudouridine synthase [Pseudothauera rhizosphaerae]|uniref:Dual-specificity RNA pseudouridine synthase RluA n=1 Tax=Pseudothauera rhizosphaerae TaxID=2565932 RepID=A0A4S4AQK7_9RHOO|nr:RluA family pseudouridine synthase [Pseudothauera rhizosphaerae]THF62039.1 RluA family pseudouridine synthase [Pseudothauera rhizosphaerae]